MSIFRPWLPTCSCPCISGCRGPILWVCYYDPYIVGIVYASGFLLKCLVTIHTLHIVPLHYCATLSIVLSSIKSTYKSTESGYGHVRNHHRACTLCVTYGQIRGTAYRGPDVCGKTWSAWLGYSL